MKRFFWTAVLLFPFVSAMFAGNLNLAEISKWQYRGDGIRAVKTAQDGETYTQLSSDGRKVESHSFKTGKTVSVLFDLDVVKTAGVDYIDGYMVSPNGRQMLIQTHTESIYRHSFKAEYYLYNMGSNRMVPLSKNGPQQTPLFSPDGSLVAFVRDGNIFLVKLLYDNAEVQVTKDGKRNAIINGIPDWVNEEEFANDRSMIFTADSRVLVWVKYDESKVKQYSMPLFKGLNPEYKQYDEYPGAYTYKYPVAGADNATTSVWSFDIASRQTRQLQVPIDADGYVPRIKQMGDASKVMVTTLNRHQDCLRIYAVNPLSTLCQLLIEERDAKYVKEECVSSLVVTNRYILLPSQRDGWLHLYLYNTNGQLLRQVETGNYDVADVYGVDDATGDVYYASHEQGAVEQQVYVAHSNGKRTCLTPKKGWNSAIFAKGFKYFISQWSDINTPAVFSLCDQRGKTLSTLVDNRELNGWLKSMNLGQRELFTLTTADGVNLNGWMVKPADFNPSKKYPVIMFQYSGPGSQSVKNAWGVGMAGQGAMLEQYLAQRGYLCVCVDGRGTGARGAEFEKCTYLQMGELESHDQVEAALWLAKQQYVDGQRMAIWGWSFGGFNTLMSMSEGRGVFRAGIAIAPPTSWKYYDTIYTERFMRTPKENPNGYDITPIKRAAQLQGSLLLCHGMADDNVHFRNTAEYTEALVQADKDFSQLVYTNRNHGISGGNTRNHLFRQCVKFFDKELK